jgi:hypothetical protein
LISSALLSKLNTSLYIAYFSLLQETKMKAYEVTMLFLCMFPLSTHAISYEVYAIRALSQQPDAFDFLGQE